MRRDSRQPSVRLARPRPRCSRRARPRVFARTCPCGSTTLLPRQDAREPTDAPAACLSASLGAKGCAMARTSIDLDALVRRVADLVRAHGALPRDELRAIK